MKTGIVLLKTRLQSLFTKVWRKIQNISSPLDIRDYIVGKLRYKLYYSKYKFLLRKHIVEQFEYRLSVINKECYNNGACIRCGCDVPALQFANKSCEGVCYPSMKSKGDWLIFKILKT